MWVGRDGANTRPDDIELGKGNKMANDYTKHWILLKCIAIQAPLSVPNGGVQATSSASKGDEHQLGVAKLQHWVLFTKEKHL